jgi:anti-anti-sigma factor
VATGTATVVIRGELDPTTTPLLCRHLAQIRRGGPRRLVLDLSGVGYMDCATARLIARTALFLPEGRRPVVQRASPLVLRVLELTGVAAHCEVDHPSG